MNMIKYNIKEDMYLLIYYLIKNNLMYITSTCVVMIQKYFKILWDNMDNISLYGIGNIVDANQ